MPQSTLRNVVLVHGGFVDGSGWAAVYRALRKDGYTVGVVQTPTVSLADDVRVTKRVIAAQNGPVILVGHSYGGVVITEAGNDPKVAGLVYVAAFAPDSGESVASLIKDPPPGAPVPPILPPVDGYLFLDRAKFPVSFAADVDPKEAEFMADSQVPWGVEALNGTISQPAWKTKPSWYLVATDDRMIPPAAQRVMAKRAGATVVESAGSHAVYVSRPDAVVALITNAAGGMKTEPAPRIDFANLPAPAEGILVTLFITVRKVARSRDFYSRILGGTVVLDENPCMVRLSNSWIIMNPGGPPTPDKPDISVVDYEPDNTTSIFLNLRVADIQACYEEWKAKGAEFLTPPIDREGEIRCYMRDPDGYLIEVGQSTGLLQGKLAAKRPEDLPG